MAWGTEPAGTYSTGGVAPSLEGGRAYFHTGLFKDTLSPFLQETGKDSFLAFANVDCNLYRRRWMFWKHCTAEWGDNPRFR
jgi:hypothetical protein